MNLDTLYAALPLPLRTPLKRLMMALLKRKLKNFYAQFVKQRSLVFDVGANDGDYAEVFKELGAKVVCIEPHPEYAAQLQKKFAKEKNIIIEQRGLGEKTGKSDFYISSFNSPNSSFSADFRKNSRYSYRTWDRVIQVQMTTLHELINQYGTPDFCKIDVEGYEWEVLSSLKKPVPVISFEFLAEMHEKTAKIITHIDTLGKAKYNLCLGMSYRYQLATWISGKKMLALLQENKTKGWNGDIYITFS